MDPKFADPSMAAISPYFKKSMLRSIVILSCCTVKAYCFYWIEMYRIFFITRQVDSGHVQHS